MSNKVENTIIGTVTVCLVGVIIFIIYGDEIYKKIQNDVFKIIFQFMMMVVAGGGISWLYKELSAKREKRSENRKEFLDFYSNIVGAYNKYKSIKRLFRAKALRTLQVDESESIEVVLSGPYQELIEELNKVQLEFESYKRHVSGNNLLFKKINIRSGNKNNTLRYELGAIEKYLNKVVQEYESAFRKFIETPDYIQLKSLPLAEEFSAPGGEASESRKKAIRCFKSIIKKLAKVSNE